MSIPGSNPPLILPEEDGAPPASNTPPANQPPAQPRKGGRMAELLDKVTGEFEKKETPKETPPGDSKPGDQKPPASGGKSKEDNIVALRQKLEALEAAKTDEAKKLQEEAEAVKKRAMEVERRLAKYNIQETLIYQEQFGDPIRQAEAAIGKTLEAAGSTVEEWQKALSTGKVAEYLQGLESKGKVAEANELVIATRAVQAIGAKAKEFVEKHQQDMAALQAEEQKAIATKKEQMTAFRTAEIQKVSETVATQRPWGVFFQKRDGQDGWNQQVDRLRGTALEIINSNDFGKQAEAAHAAALLPGLLAEVSAYRKEIAALKGRLGIKSQAVKAAAGTGGGGTVQTPPAAQAPRSWQEESADTAKSAVAGLRKKK